MDVVVVGCAASTIDSSVGVRDDARASPGKPNLRLKSGDHALYHPISCGASCAPASLWFVHRGVLYSWQLKEPPHHAKAVLAQLADEAIAAGPR